MAERFEGAGAQDYDGRIPLLVPGYELLHRLSAAQLMTRLGPGGRVLLVGVGTGSELLLLGRLCPHWQFVAQDISADMLAQARWRAEQAGMGAKAGLLAAIARQLTPGAPLLLADLMAAQDPSERAVMGQQARLAGLPAAASEQMVRRLADDFIPLDEAQTQGLLREAGFTAGRRYFQALGFHGWLAERMPL